MELAVIAPAAEVAQFFDFGELAGALLQQGGGALLPFTEEQGQGADGDAAEHDKQQALAGLQQGNLLGIAEQEAQQAVAEENPQDAEQQIGCGQFAGQGQVRTHG